MNELIESLISLSESSVDFPRKDLCPDIWQKIGDSYKIKPEVKKIIFKLLDTYNIINLKELASTIHITGSAGTNLFPEDSDIDVHLIVDSKKIKDPEGLQREVFKYYRKEENIVKIAEHPLEVYIQYVPEQELLSESLYDLIDDKWIIGPKIVPDDYNPLEDFSNVMKEVQNLAGEADKGLGELKRDTIDYDMITKAIEGLDGASKKKLINVLKNKLHELENDIEDLMKLKGEWIKMRRNSSKPSSEKQALEDVSLARKFRDANAIFKYLSRYKYIKVISKLETMLKDGELDSDEINTVRQILGVEK